jgi:glucan biosynthesis protein
VGFAAVNLYVASQRVFVVIVYFVIDSVRQFLNTPSYDCFLSLVITMSEQVVPSAVAQRIMVKFVTNENVKPAEILMRLRAQFGDETLSRTLVYYWSKSFREC